MSESVIKEFSDERSRADFAAAILVIGLHRSVGNRLSVNYVVIRFEKPQHPLVAPTREYGRIPCPAASVLLKFSHLLLSGH